LFTITIFRRAGIQANSLLCHPEGSKGFRFSSQDSAAEKQTIFPALISYTKKGGNFPEQEGQMSQKTGFRISFMEHRRRRLFLLY
jgi:hypothetical protein